MTLGERIKNRRLELGLSQTDLALRLGYKSKVSVSNAENDRDDMTTTRIEKYAKALHVTPAYLMGWEDTPSDDLVELASKVQPTVDLHIDDYFMELPNVMGIQRTERVKELLDYTHQLNDENIDALIKYAKFLSHDDSLIRKDDADD